jgi:hypothetical protein
MPRLRHALTVPFTGDHAPVVALVTLTQDLDGMATLRGGARLVAVRVAVGTDGSRAGNAGRSRRTLPARVARPGGSPVILPDLLYPGLGRA